MDLRHGLAYEPPVFAALDREAILAQRLRVVAFLPEREPQVVMRELAAFGDLRLRLFAQPVLGRLPLGTVALQGQVGLGAGERRVELDGPLGRGARLLVAAPVAERQR